MERHTMFLVTDEVLDRQHELLLWSGCFNWPDQKINKLAQTSRLTQNTFTLYQNSDIIHF
jgi:hypothetical protein